VAVDWATLDFSRFTSLARERLSPGPVRPNLAAASEAAIVELTSPTTNTTSGFCSTRTGSIRFRISAVCHA
jgi:hypothetical protein